MAGIYIHVPFCKTRCIYCDFFTKTNLEEKNPYIHALCEEIKLRSNYLEGESIQTIYFGGGTPSQLSENDFESIFKIIRSEFNIDSNAEITVEANPDDLTIDYIQSLLRVGFNRLSMGIQSFDDNQLSFLKRRHSASKAVEAVKMSQQVGFKNISIDLMYGLPQLTMDTWIQSIETAITLDIQHISAYHLIYEEGTKLYKLLQKGEVKSIDEELSVEMFSTMIDKLTAADFLHYEISNFGKKDSFSQHNSSYWLGKKYLGLGPSAHSFNGINRCWNIKSIPNYIKAIQLGTPSLETENLDKKELYNEFVLTGMRTMWGINVEELKKRFGEELLVYCIKNLKKYLSNEDVVLESNSYRITKKGIFISDSIMSDLMYIG